MPSVQTSDGRTLVFPDGMSKDDMAAALSKLPAPGSVAESARAHLAANATQGADGQWTPSETGADIPQPRPAPAQPEPRSVVQEIGSVNPASNAIGGAKGALETLYTAYRNTANQMQNRPSDTVRDPKIEAALIPQSLGEKIGRFGEKMYEFIGGEKLAVGAVSKVTPMVAAKVIGRVAAGAAVTAGQGGSGGDMAANAVLGAGLPVLFEGIGGGLKMLGQKLQLSQLRASVGAMAEGFKPETLNKYGLSGMSLGGTLENVHNKIVDLATRLRAITQGSPATINFDSAINDTEKELLSRSSQLKNPGEMSKYIKTAIEDYRGWASSLPGGSDITIDEAQTLKRGVGLNGAWQYGKTAADSGQEKVANVLYSKLKDGIEQALGTQGSEAQAINRQLGELMPVEQVIIRRIPVAARNNPLSLTDLMLLATGHPAAAAGHVASRTMAGATATYGAGKAIQAVAPAATAASQVTMGAVRRRLRSAD